MMMQTSIYRPSEEQMELIDSNAQCKYHKYRYYGLTIFESWDHRYFNATVLMKQISKKTPALMLQCKDFRDLVGTDALWTPPTGTKGVITHGFGGQYIEWDLFPDTLTYARPGALRKIAKGIPLTNDTQGYLYWCKPDEKKHSCIGTNTVKVGRTWKWERRAGVYHKDNTVLYRLIQVNDMYELEKLMKKAVSQLLTRNAAVGAEYYILQDADTETWNKVDDVFDTLLAISDSEYRIRELKNQLETETDEECVARYNYLIDSYTQDINNLKSELENMQ